MIKYKFSEGAGSALTLYDSYAVSKKDFQKTLDDIRKIEGGDKKIFERTDKSLKREWACHNFAYMLGYERDRTKDCDLDNPCDRPEWIYKLVGFFVWIFIP